MTAHQIIIQDNKFCQFKTADTTLFNSLRRYLSYKTIGVEYTAAYQNGWDGVNFLMSKKGVFASGLLTKVKAFLIDQNIAFDIQDKRKSVITNAEIDISAKLNELNLIPREHQIRILNACLENNKGIVRSATGSGKSVCMALLTAKLNKPTIVYVIGLDLLKQFHDLFTSLFNEPIGFIGNGVCDIQRINIATIWTISRALKLDKKDISDDESDNSEEFNESHSEKIIKMLQQTKAHIFDESQYASTISVKTIWQNIDPEYIYGFSGTPFRDDNSDLLINGILGEQIIDIPASDLIKKKLLAQPIIKFVPVPKMPNMSSANYQTIYKDYVVKNNVRNNLIIEYAKELLDKKYQVLILFKQIKHGKILKDLFDQNNIVCEYLSGTDSIEIRNEAKQNLLSHKSNLLLASTIADIGIDIPSLSALILANPSRAKGRCLQRLGRCLRKYEGKQYVAVVDFYDQIKFLKLHANIRYETYCSEPGFKVIKCKEMK